MKGLQEYCTSYNNSLMFKLKERSWEEGGRYGLRSLWDRREEQSSVDLLGPGRVVVVK